MFLFERKGGAFQLAQGGRAGVPIGVMDITENIVRDACLAGQGQLFEPLDRGAHRFQRLIDQPHEAEANRTILRLSTVSHETSPYDAIAECCEVVDKGPMAGTLDARRRNIAAFMKARKLKMQPWAKAAGLAESALRNYLAGRTVTMTLDALDRLAAAADTTVADLIGEKPREPRIGRDMVAIKSLEVRASMGGGYDVVEEPEGPPFYFRREWVDHVLQGKPGQLRIITCQGDSMSPTIHDGDAALVLLGREDVQFESGAIYAVWNGHGLLVKRLETRLGGDNPQLWVVSDNKAIYERYMVEIEDLIIIGRVVWRGGKV